MNSITKLIFSEHGEFIATVEYSDPKKEPHIIVVEEGEENEKFLVETKDGMMPVTGYIVDRVLDNKVCCLGVRCDEESQ